MATTQFDTQVTGKKTPPKVTLPSAGTVSAGALAGMVTAAHENMRFNNIMNIAKTKMSQRDIGTELGNVLNLPRTAENVNRAKALMDERGAKIAANPSLSAYADDDLMQRAKIYTATPGFRSEVDYASAISQLATQPVTAETKKQMRELLSARMSKIAAGGADMTQYENDEISALAKNYLNYYAPEHADMTGEYDKADALAKQSFADMEDSLRRQQDAQRELLRDSFDEQRRQNDLAYAIRSRAIENVLAQQGLGRGLGAAPSSGYSESARVGALADYASGINDTYAQEQAAVSELAARFDAQRLQAMQQRDDALRQNLLARISQANADREFDAGVHNLNTEFDRQALAQKNLEAQLAEDTRRYDEGMLYQKEKDALAQRNWQAEFDENVRRYGLDTARQMALDEFNKWLATENLKNAQAQTRAYTAGLNYDGGSLFDDAQAGLTP